MAHDTQGRGRKSRPWFRFYVEAVHDRKLRRLKPETRWLFVACLCAARQSCEPGWLLVGPDDPMTVDDLADYAGMVAKAVSDGMKSLCESGVLGFDDPRVAWFVTNWNARQFESDDVTNRTRKHRERSKEPNRNVPNTFQGTPPDTESETDTETEGLEGLPPVTEGWFGVGSPQGQASLVAHWRSSYAKAHAGHNPTTPYTSRLRNQLDDFADIPYADMELIVGWIGKDGKDPKHLPLVVSDFYKDRQAGAV